MIKYITLFYVSFSLVGCKSTTEKSGRTKKVYSM